MCLQGTSVRCKNPWMSISKPTMEFHSLDEQTDTNLHVQAQSPSGFSDAGLFGGRTNCNGRVRREFSAPSKGVWAGAQTPTNMAGLKNPGFHYEKRLPCLTVFTIAMRLLYVWGSVGTDTDREEVSSSPVFKLWFPVDAAILWGLKLCLQACLYALYPVWLFNLFL